MFTIKKAPEESAITLDIHFQDDLTPLSIFTLTIELLKILMLQRKQVPDSIDTMLREVASSKCERHLTEPEESNNETGSQPDSRQNHRDQQKRRRDVERRKKLEQKYLKRAGIVVEIFNRMTQTLRTEIVDDAASQTEEVAIVFGATPVTPKEIYRFQFPTNFSENRVSNQTLNRRAMQQLFRTIITHEDLFNRIGKELSLTNTYLAVKKRGVLHDQMPPHFAFHPEFLESSLRKCKETIFCLRPQSASAATAAIDTVIETPMRRMLPPSRSVSYTPCAMDMCTPLGNRSNIVLPNNAELEITPFRTSDPALKPGATSRNLLDRARHLSGLEAVIEDPSDVNDTVFGSLTLSSNDTTTKKAEKVESNEGNGSASTQTNTEKNVTSNWFFLTEHIKGFRDPFLESA